FLLVVANKHVLIVTHDEDHDELGKVKNPWPNVDAHSGVLLNYSGLTDARYKIYAFAVAVLNITRFSLVYRRQSESVLSSLERPKSVTMEWLENHCKNGMKLYISDSKVILTEGFDGAIPVEYFESIKSWPDRKLIPIETQAT
ncbi:citrate synthase, mitochondrial, partial [Tanacetum coccineum]